MQGKSQKTKGSEKINIHISQKADLLSTNRFFFAATFQLVFKEKHRIFLIANLFFFQFYLCMTGHGVRKETVIWLQKMF